MLIVLCLMINCRGSLSVFSICLLRNYILFAWTNSFRIKARTESKRKANHVSLYLSDSILDWTAVLLGVPTASVRLESSSGVTGTIKIEQV